MSEIAECFQNKSLFITGALGFMGKVLLEKLLYNCGQEINEIYILVRPKRGKTCQSRVEDLAKLPLFEKLVNNYPERLKKLIPIEGNLTNEDLGLSQHDNEQLINNVNIVIHGGASLRLEAELKENIIVNTEGTLKVLELAKQMTQLNVFVHLSTAFCHVDHKILEEKIYETHINPLDLIALSKWMSDEMFKKITKDLLGPHPNSYTFSKRLSETLVETYSDQIPVIIIRPSIVTPAVKYPLNGWVDSLNGPTGLMIAAGKGVIRSMLCHAEYQTQVIPVDMAISGIIIITAQEMQKVPRKCEIPVYNLTQGNTNKVKWGELLEMSRKICYENPFEIMLWYPDGNIRTNKYVHRFYEIFCHWLPAYFIDFMLMIFQQKTFMLRVARRVQDGLDVLQYFTLRDWKFNNDKILKLRRSLKNDDKIIYDLNFELVDVPVYIKNSLNGAKRFILKEKENALPRSRRLLKILWFADRSISVLFYGLIIWMLINWSSSLKDGMDYLLDAFFNLSIGKNITTS